MKILLLRHGKTAGNEEHRYVGRTDEELSVLGIRELSAKREEGRERLPKPELVFTSPMKRCVQTARLFFPGAVIQVEERLTECDFGAFEYKNYRELTGREDYQAWIDSGGRMDVPGGERMSDFKSRSLAGFLACAGVAEEKGHGVIAFIVHGGTIMAVMEALAVPKKDYYSWQVKNLAGYLCRMENGWLEVLDAYD